MAPVVPFIPAIAGGLGALFGKGKSGKDLQSLRDMTGKESQMGLGNLATAGTNYNDMLNNPEQWTGGTAADLGRETQQQAGTMQRVLGRSGAAGAGLSNLYANTYKNNLSERLGAKKTALSGISQLGLGETGQSMQGQSALIRGGQIQDQSNRGFFGGIGSNIMDTLIGSGGPNPLGDLIKKKPPSGSDTWNAGGTSF